MMVGDRLTYSAKAGTVGTYLAKNRQEESVLLSFA